MYLSLLKSGEMTGRFLCKEANPTLWAAKNTSLQESPNNDEKITVVIPGGFKPPHRGHVEMINHFANMSNVEEVIVFTGSKPRESADGSVVVTAEKAKKLFNLFDLAPNVSLAMSDNDTRKMEAHARIHLWMPCIYYSTKSLLERT